MAEVLAGSYRPLSCSVINTVVLEQFAFLNDHLLTGKSFSNEEKNV